MFDESGTEYRPRPVPKPAPTPAETPKSVPGSEEQFRQRYARRPLWLHVTTSFLMFLFFLRVAQFCYVSDDQPVTLIAHFAMTGVMGVILLGLLGIRRWGVWLFLLFCTWNIVSSLVVGIYRIVMMRDVVENTYNARFLIMSEIITIGMVMGFYGLLAAWFWYKRSYFLPSIKPTDWGGVTYTVIVSIMILVTATQIADSRQYIRLAEKELETNRAWLQERW